MKSNEIYTKSEFWIMINMTLRRHRKQRHVWLADKRGEHVEIPAAQAAEQGLENVAAATGLQKIQF